MFILRKTIFLVLLLVINASKEWEVCADGLNVETEISPEGKHDDTTESEVSISKDAQNDLNDQLDGPLEIKDFEINDEAVSNVENMIDVFMSKITAISNSKFYKGVVALLDGSLNKLVHSAPVSFAETKECHFSFTWDEFVKIDELDVKANFKTRQLRIIYAYHYGNEELLSHVSRGTMDVFVDEACDITFCDVVGHRDGDPNLKIFGRNLVMMKFVRREEMDSDFEEIETVNRPQSASDAELKAN